MLEAAASLRMGRQAETQTLRHVVGELLIKRMLSSKIIFQCVEELILVKNDEALETLTVLA